MVSASKTTFCHYNLKSLKPKVTKNLTNCPRNFSELLEDNEGLSDLASSVAVCAMEHLHPQTQNVKMFWPFI